MCFVVGYVRTLQNNNYFQISDSDVSSNDDIEFQHPSCVSQEIISLYDKTRSIVIHFSLLLKFADHILLFLPFSYLNSVTITTNLDTSIQMAVVTTEIAKAKKKYVSGMIIIFIHWLNNRTWTRYYIQISHIQKVPKKCMYTHFDRRYLLIEITNKKISVLNHC